MGKAYYRNEEMVTGGVFKCYNCLKKLISHISGKNYVIKLKCPRCSAIITIECREPILFAARQIQDNSELKKALTDVKLEEVLHG